MFFLEDGSYLPVDTALRQEYTGLINRDVPVLVEASDMVTILFDVNRSTPVSETMTLISCAVAGILVPRLPGDLAGMKPPGKC